MSNRPYRPKDFFFQKAKESGFRARSAFKIEEIADRFKVFKRGGAVLDLGAAPGGFMQVIAAAVGEKGRVVGVDLAPIKPLGRPNVQAFVADVLADDFDAQLEGWLPGALDAVVSDLAPKTTGIKVTDEARSLRLAGKALEIAQRKLKPGGHFVAKLFMGGDFEQFLEAVRAGFEDTKVVRPEATRGASVEVYLVGLRRSAKPPR